MLNNSADLLIPVNNRRGAYNKQDDDNAPWDSFQKRKLPKELIESIEGDLMMDELHKALFFFM